jgi:hypothetical protein
VTTALEMEIGKPDVAAFLQSHANHSLINYGTTASHVAARSLAFSAPLPELLPNPVRPPISPPLQNKLLA